MTYAKILSATLIDTNPPKSAIIGEKFIVGKLPADYLASIGYYPLIEETMPEADEGCHIEARYRHENGNTVKGWIQVENPVVAPMPRSLSKVKLYRALRDAGMWDTVKSYMEENDVWEEFSLSTTLDEDNPLISAAIQAMEGEMEIPHDVIQGLLDASVAD